MVEPLKEADVTPEAVYLNRRQFLSAAGLAALSIAAPRLTSAAQDKLTPYEDLTHYNNFYEFGTDKYSPAKLAGTLRTRPWTVRVDGLCKNPKTWDLDALLKKFPSSQRVYRLRCVEGWSAVVPWEGFELAGLLKAAQPLPRAKYAAFWTLHDPAQMPGVRSDVLDWPYREGLRLDEAMHPLTIMATGMYGKPLLNQNGAPIRLVVPWKYGFKSIKSVVRISFVAEQPPTAWNAATPKEYGFYSNVNPQVDHPRWSQATERRLGELFRRPTLMFNGYGEVASLYKGMDLLKNY